MCAWQKKKRTGEIGTNAGKKMEDDVVREEKEKKRKNDDSVFIFFIKELLSDVFH